MAFDDKMRRLRLVRGMSQDELAKQAGISRVSIGFYERGERVPPADVAARIARALQVSVDELLDIGADFNSETNADEDKRFQRACDTLNIAGFDVTPDESSTFARWRIRYDDYNIDTIEDEDRLMDIVDEALRDAEARKELYLKKRLIAEFDRGE